MKIRHIVALLFACLSAVVALAQSTLPPAPAVPPAPPSPSDPVAPDAKTVEGVLLKSQRVSGDRGKYSWICTYRVVGTPRSVQLDESCPQTMPFELKR